MNTNNMVGNNRNVVPTNKVNVGYDSAYLSFAIVALNVIAAIIKLNSTVFSDFSMSDSTFFISILVLLLTSLDILLLYKKIERYQLTNIAKKFAILSLVGTSTIIALTVGIYCGICDIDKNGCVILIGNIVETFTNKPVILFKQHVCLWIYLFSALFQAVSNVCKIFYNRQIKR